jgi:hypothetical protein
MKKLLASLAALSALALAAPASADPPRDYRNERSYDNDGYRGDNYRGDYGRDDFRRGPNFGFDQRLDRLEWRLREGTRRGDLNQWEARRFWGDLRDIREMKRSFQYSNGISPREAQILDNRIDRFGYALRAELRDDRYGWNNDNRNDWGRPDWRR